MKDNQYLWESKDHRLSHDLPMESGVSGSSDFSPWTWVWWTFWDGTQFSPLLGSCSEPGKVKVTTEQPLNNKQVSLPEVTLQLKYFSFKKKFNVLRYYRFNFLRNYFPPFTWIIKLATFNLELGKLKMSLKSKVIILKYHKMVMLLHLKCLNPKQKHWTFSRDLKFSLSKN